jgi:hypothetical protein
MVTEHLVGDLLAEPPVAGPEQPADAHRRPRMGG